MAYRKLVWNLEYEEVMPYTIKLEKTRKIQYIGEIYHILFRKIRVYKPHHNMDLSPASCVIGSLPSQ